LPKPAVIIEPSRIADILLISEVGGVCTRKGYPDPHCLVPSVVSLMDRYVTDMEGFLLSDKYLNGQLSYPLRTQLWRASS
jgi:hypothetical protein